MSFQSCEPGSHGLPSYLQPGLAPCPDVGRMLFAVLRSEALSFRFRVGVREQLGPPRAFKPERGP